MKNNSLLLALRLACHQLKKHWLTFLKTSCAMMLIPFFFAALSRVMVGCYFSPFIDCFDIMCPSSISNELVATWLFLKIGGTVFALYCAHAFILRVVLAKSDSYKNLFIKTLLDFMWTVLGGVIVFLYLLCVIALAVKVLDMNLFGFQRYSAYLVAALGCYPLLRIGFFPHALADGSSNVVSAMGKAYVITKRNSLNLVCFFVGGVCALIATIRIIVNIDQVVSQIFPLYISGSFTLFLSFYMQLVGLLVCACFYRQLCNDAQKRSIS